MLIKSRYIKIFVLIILIILCIMVYVKGKEFKEENCSVTFNSAPPGQKIEKGGIFEIKININELYDELQNGNCKVIWSKTQGFRLS